MKFRLLIKIDYKKISFIAILVSIIAIFLVISKSYAIYKLEEKFNLFENQIKEYKNGDVMISALVDGKEADEFPSYETNYKVESIECSNGVVASWDIENWRLAIDDMNATSTKCTINFDSTRKNKISPINMTKKELLALNDEMSSIAAVEVIKKVYPVGSIYMSTEDDTIDKVEQKFGGTWVKYGEDMTLVGASSTKAVNSTGGNSTITIGVANLPNHTHTIPALSVSTWSGSHSHQQNRQNWVNASASSNRYTTPSGSGYYFNTADMGVSNLYTYATTVTVSGQTTTASKTSTCDNCSASSIDVTNPYVAVYMYKRTA